MMLVDCQTCPVRDVHCADCMVTALMAIPLRDPHDDPIGHEVVSMPLDRAERRAVSAFLAAGLVTTATANAARAVPDPVATAGSVGSVGSVGAVGAVGQAARPRVRRAV